MFSTYATSETKRYLCHKCNKFFNKIFIEAQPIECLRCHSSICEEVSQEGWSDTSEVPFQYAESRSLSRIRSSYSAIAQVIIREILRLDDENQGMENYLRFAGTNIDTKNSPTTKEALQSLVTKTLAQEEISSMGVENICAICKEEFYVGDNCKTLPCVHIFHSQCIVPWLCSSHSCPICRYELPHE